MEWFQRYRYRFVGRNGSRKANTIESIAENKNSKKENRKTDDIQTRRRTVIYYAQIGAIYTIVIVSLVSLSLRGDVSAIWSALLSVGIAYLIPSPKLKKTTKMTHFYMTLPSNSSTAFYPENTLADFKTKLMTSIELNGDWEVGMSEIMYPRSWFNIPDGGIYIRVDCSKCDVKPDYLLPKMDASELPDYLLSDMGGSEFSRDLQHVWDYVILIYIHGGYYDSMKALVESLQNASQHAFTPADTPVVSKMLRAPKFDYNELNKRICITLESGMVMELPQVLETILGITSNQNPVINGTRSSITIMGENACDIQGGIHALYTYCDLLEHIPVGDTRAPLLRIVDIEGENGTMQVRRYERPRYVPIQKKQFDSIQIIIRNDIGEPISFESGKLMVTLHFRRAQNQYFL